MKLDEKLTPEDQAEILGGLLGFQIIDEVIHDEDGYEFYGNTRNRDVDLTTIRGIFTYARDDSYRMGEQHGRSNQRILIRKALGID